jgi:hypothetical protein
MWPQFTLIVWFLIILMTHTINHGKPTTHHAYAKLTQIVLWTIILYYGGFWAVMLK